MVETINTPTQSLVAIRETERERERVGDRARKKETTYFFTRL